MYELDEDFKDMLKDEIYQIIFSFVDEEKKKKILEEIVSLNDSIDEGLPSEETVASMQAVFESSVSQAKETAISEFKSSLLQKEEDMLAEIQTERNKAIKYLGTLESLIGYDERDLSKLGALHFIKKKRLRESIERYTRDLESQKKKVLYLEAECELKTPVITKAIKEQIEIVPQFALPTSPWQKFIAQKYIYQIWPFVFSNMASAGLSRNSDIQNKGLSCCILVILSMMNCAVNLSQICEVLEYVKEQASFYDLPDFIGSVSDVRVLCWIKKLMEDELVERFLIDDYYYYIIKNTK